MPKIKFLSLICLTASFCFLLYYIYSTNFNDELQILRTQFELKNQQILILKNEINGLYLKKLIFYLNFYLNYMYIFCLSLFLEHFFFILSISLHIINFLN